MIKNKILFVTPSLANTGSEILLFNFINFLSSRYTISVICYEYGNLVASLDESVVVHILNLKQPKTIYEKLIRRFKLHFSIPKLFNKYKNYTWYINTIVLPIPVKYAIDHKINFLIHSHELKHMYNLLSIEQLDYIFNRPKLLIANSSITKTQMIEHGSKNKIEIVFPFVDISILELYKKRVETSNPFCWVMAGSIDKNKNPKLFLAIAKEAKKKNLPYKFVWLYQVVTDEYLFSEIKQYIKSQNLAVDLIYSKNYNDYLSNFASANGFLLTSINESFSMTTLEAMAFQFPLVLNDCGGVREIVNDQFASIIPVASSVDIYLEAMKKEMMRANIVASEKNETLKKFDRNKTLKHWEELLSSVID